MESKERIAARAEAMKERTAPRFEELKKKMGRPSQAEKKGIEMSIEGEFVVIKVPRKDLTKRLLSDILN
ncbi:MAG: hypothetical protein EOP04_21695 [Proteobacteria bacterium]|nr:MAG: hypothetical protein EOP04_21695 [Pseudomonadota bacterium]